MIRSTRSASYRLVLKVALALAAVLAAVGLASCAFVKVGRPSGVTLHDATLNGQVGSGFDWEGEWWFEYGRTGGLGEQTPRSHVFVAAGTREPESAAVTGLEGATAYFYRLCAEDSERRFPPLCSGQHFVHTGDSVRADNGVFSTSAGFGADVTVDATSGPSGEEPAGRVDFDYLSPDDRPDLTGPVTCLAVDGQRAAVGVENENGEDFVLGVAVSTSPSGSLNKFMGLYPAPADPSHCPSPRTLPEFPPWTVAGVPAKIIDGPFDESCAFGCYSLARAVRGQ